jgi:hypothetical protein
VKWIRLAHDGVQWRATVDTVYEFSGSITIGEFLDQLSD